MSDLPSPVALSAARAIKSLLDAHPELQLVVAAALPGDAVVLSNLPCSEDIVCFLLSAIEQLDSAEELS